MEFRDFTPFSSISFNALDKEDTEYHIVVMKGTFDIIPDEDVVISSKQDSLALTDQYSKETNQSSVLYESDLSPFKPKTDILLNATAYAPQSIPSSRWEVSVEVGGHKKELIITGPRFWDKTDDAWIMTEPAPITQLPIRYEYAYGGTFVGHNDDNDDENCYKQNPLGTGYCPPSHLKNIRRVSAPQIESPSDPIREFPKEHIPQGLGPIGRSWHPRIARAGTYDELWQKERSPYLPLDFDFGYWNCAHPDLIVPYLKGTEEVILKNLTPQGLLSFNLPGHIPYVLIRYEDGTIIPGPARLDTLSLFPDTLTAHCVWRMVVPAEPGVRVLEARLIRKENKTERKDLIDLLEVTGG